jgi:ABC-type uncharacterized transport system permease subunit
VSDREFELAPDDAAPDPSGLGPEVKQSLLGKYDVAQKAGGLLAPVLTAVLAFLAGGLVVLVTTGKNPLTTYRAIFEGAGFSWFFPWVTGTERATAALNMQQTLIIATSLVLTALAVGFAFRCGLFNIGGQGQYIVGAVMAVWVGSSFAGLSPWLHAPLTVIVGALCGAVWAGIAGVLKATVGAHEVISTIMLNWIAIWVGVFLFGLGGPLQNDAQKFVPISNDIAQSAKLPVFWGDPIFQGLHIGFFIAIAALIVYWLILTRTTLGYGVKAVGFNPEAARYGGISVPRNYLLAMAISGTFAGLAGAIDITGWQFRLATGDVQAATIAFVGIAVALLGRNTAIGIALASLLFAGLLTGTSTRNLDPTIFKPALASNLTLLIQGLVVLFVGADVIVLWLLSRFRRSKAA